MWSHIVGAGIFIYFLFRDIFMGEALPFMTSSADYYIILFYTVSVVVSLCIILFCFR